MKTFSRKTRERIYKKYNWQCANFKADNCKLREGLSIHHVVHNTKVNEKLYGDKLQNEENGVLLCQQCHNNYSTIVWIEVLRQTLISLWESQAQNQDFPKSDQD